MALIAGLLRIANSFQSMSNDVAYITSNKSVLRETETDRENEYKIGSQNKLISCPSHMLCR